MMTLQVSMLPGNAQTGRIDAALKGSKYDWWQLYLILRKDGSPVAREICGALKEEFDRYTGTVGTFDDDKAK